MSGYLVTSPYGTERYHRWFCDECPVGGGGAGSERDDAREAASGHVEAPGHGVIVIDGTREHLYPVATEAHCETGGES